LTLGPWCCSECPPFVLSKFLFYFSTLNKEGALNDIKENNIKILYREGMISVNFKTSEHKTFEDRFNIKFYTQGCVRTIGDDEAGYNSVIFDYIDKKYGFSWRLQMPEGVIGLEKLDQCKKKLEVDFLEYKEMMLKNQLNIKLNRKKAQKNKKVSTNFNFIKYVLSSCLFLLLLFVFYKWKNRNSVRR
jgi:hypothetical protein